MWLWVFAVTALMSGHSARAEVIDRVMAVVDGALILQSDIAVARRFGLVPGAAAAPGEIVLDRLIERRLVLTEVNRYGPLEPPQAWIERRVEEARARFDSPQAFDAALAASGIGLDELRRIVRDDLRIDGYLRQRFAAALQPSEAEILEYYRDHQEMFARGGVVRPYAEAHEEARSALVEERRSSTIRTWVDQLRRRANVSVPGIVPIR